MTRLPLQIFLPIATCLDSWQQCLRQVGARWLFLSGGIMIVSLRKNTRRGAAESKVFRCRRRQRRESPRSAAIPSAVEKRSGRRGLSCLPLSLNGFRSTNATATASRSLSRFRRRLKEQRALAQTCQPTIYPPVPPTSLAFLSLLGSGLLAFLSTNATYKVLKRDAAFFSMHGCRGVQLPRDILPQKLSDISFRLEVRCWTPISQLVQRTQPTA